MNGRTTTNILLAVIAGVLLFGQSAMTGALQVGAIVLAVLVVLAIVVSGILGFITLAAEDWRIQATRRGQLESAAGYAMMPFGAAFGLTVGWFWLQGAQHPVGAAMWSPFGIAWMIVVAILVTAFVGGGLWSLVKTVIANRHQAPTRIKNAALYAVIALVAVVAFPIREWRAKRLEGSGVISAAASSTMMAFFGLMLTMFSDCRPGWLSPLVRGDHRVTGLQSHATATAHPSGGVNKSRTLRLPHLGHRIRSDSISIGMSRPRV